MSNNALVRWILGVCCFLAVPLPSLGAVGTISPAACGTGGPTTACSTVVRGAAPLAVFVDARATSCVGCSAALPGDPNPRLHELEYLWDFADPGSGTWTIPGTNIAGESRNTATGFINAHVFERPGSYAVRLTVRDPATGTSAATTLNVVVDDPDATWANGATVCVNQAGDADFSGCPVASVSAHVNSTDWDGVLQTYYAPGRRVLFKCGNRFSADRTTSIETNSHVGGYGIGGVGCAPSNRVKVTFTSVGTLFDENASGVNPTGTRLTDFEVRWNTLHTQNFLFSPLPNGIGDGTHFFRNLLIYNTRIPAGGNMREAVSIDAGWYVKSGENVPDGVFMIDNDWEDSDQNNIYVSASHMVIMGNRVVDAEDGEHLTRLPWWENLVFAHNYYARENPGHQKHALTMRGLNIAGGDPTNQNGCAGRSQLVQCDSRVRFAVVQDSEFHVYGMALEYCSNVRQEFTVECQDIVVERNAFNKLPQADNKVFMNAKQPTFGLSVRRNIFDMTNDVRGVGTTAIKLLTPDGRTRVTNNTCYEADVATTKTWAVCIQGFGQTGVIARGNLFHIGRTRSGVTKGMFQSLSPAVDENNLFVDGGTSPFVTAVPSSGFATFSPAQYQLKAGSVAVDYTPQSTVASSLIDYGFQALADARPDAGAWEFGGTPIAGSVPTVPPPSTSPPPTSPPAAVPPDPPVLLP